MSSNNTTPSIPLQNMGSRSSRRPRRSRNQYDRRSRRSTVDTQSNAQNDTNNNLAPSEDIPNEDPTTTSPSVGDSSAGNMSRYKKAGIATLFFLTGEGLKVAYDHTHQAVHHALSQGWDQVADWGSGIDLSEAPENVRRFFVHHPEVTGVVVTFVVVGGVVTGLWKGYTAAGYRDDAEEAMAEADEAERRDRALEDGTVGVSVQ